MSSFKKKKGNEALSPDEREALRQKKYPFLYRQVTVRLDSDGKPSQTILKRRSLWPIYLGILFLVTILLGVFFIPQPRSIKLDQFFVLLGQMFHDSEKLTPFGGYWGYIGSVAIPKIWQTVQMCFIATALGSILSIPFFLLASRNIAKKIYVYGPVRVLVNVIRTIPTFVLALICVQFTGYNETSGIIAMTIFTFGVLFKLMYEYIETCDMSPFEAFSSTGASRGQSFVGGVWPQVHPVFLSNILYTFEINIRASVVLGFVGAGGIGQIMNDAIADRAYEKVGCVIIPLFVLVVFLQLLSSYVRRKFQ